jgi:hypothetical protein
MMMVMMIKTNTDGEKLNILEDILDKLHHWQT